jgi:hypothetical protein
MPKPTNFDEWLEGHVATLVASLKGQGHTPAQAMCVLATALAAIALHQEGGDPSGFDSFAQMSLARVLLVLRTAAQVHLENDQTIN